MVVGGTALERMIFFFKAGLFLHPKRSAFILTSELTAADERPARSSYLSLRLDQLGRVVPDALIRYGFR